MNGSDEESSPLIAEEERRDKKSSAWRIIRYFVLALVAAGILAVFIKGFIDAEDVEVIHKRDFDHDLSQ